MLYQISYELKSNNQDYSSLYASIKKLGDWMRPLETVWYVNTELPIKEVFQTLMDTVDQKSDKIIISEVTSQVIGGRASTEFWEWLKKSFKG